MGVHKKYFFKLAKMCGTRTILNFGSLSLSIFFRLTSLLFKHIPENLENITIPHNEAVLPSIQLLSVLHPASGRDHLPECLTQIYENPKIKEYYPDEYEIDYSGNFFSFLPVCVF